MTVDPGADFAAVWKAVLTELNGDSASSPLTAQQRAWLKLVRPLTIAEGFALLSVPNPYVHSEIERHLRGPIVEALTRRCLLYTSPSPRDS